MKYCLSHFKRIFFLNDLFKNIFFSVISQGINYLFPLITFPFLVHQLGVSAFGSISFSQNITNYLASVVIFGFNLTITNEVAQSQSDFTKINRIFHEVFFARILLFLLCFILLIVSISIVQVLNQTWKLHLLAFVGVLAWVFQSEYYYQGIQKVKILAFSNFLSRTIALVMILLSVNTPSDTEIAMLGFSIGGALGGILCFIWAYVKYNLNWYIPSISAISKQISLNYHVFFSSIAVSFYSSVFNIFILGFVTNNLLVGYYSIADRVYLLVCAMSLPIYQALLPYLSKLSVSNFEVYKKSIKKIAISIITVYIILAVCIYLTAPQLIKFISGGENFQSVEVLRILVFSMPFYQFGNIYTNIFIIHNNKKNIAILNGSLVILNISLIYPMLHYFGINGLAYNNLIVLIAMTFIGYYLVKSKNIIQPILAND